MFRAKTGSRRGFWRRIVRLPLRDNEHLVAWAAFVLSGGHAMIALSLYMQGSNIDIHPKSALLYVQHGTSASVLSGAVGIVVTNESPWYGDAFINANGRLSTRAERRPLEGLVQPRFGATCPPNVRCAPLNQLSVQFTDDDVTSLAPLDAKTIWISFELSCTDFRSACDVRNALDTARALHGNSWTFDIEARFVHEGTLSFTCTFGPVDAREIQRRDWTSMDCT